MEKDWIQCMTVLISNPGKLNLRYVDFHFIHSAAMFDLVTANIKPNENSINKLTLNALYHKRIELAKKYQQLDPDPKFGLIIEIMDQKPHLISMLHFIDGVPIKIELYPIKTQIHGIDPEDIQWLLVNGCPYSRSYLMEYQEINPDMFHWLQINCFI